MPSLKTHIAGVQFRKGATAYLAQLSQEREDEKAKGEDHAPIKFRLLRDPKNKYDPNAVEIHDDLWSDGAEDGFLGFVPKDWSSEIARIMDEGTKVTCEYLTKQLVLLTWDEDEAQSNIAAG